MSRLIRTLSLCTLAVAVGACEPAADPPPPPATSPEATAEGPDAVPPTPDPVDDHAAHAAPSSATALASPCVSTPRTPVFRVTARTNGPRGVEALSQALFTLPIE